MGSIFFTLGDRLDVFVKKKTTLRAKRKGEKKPAQTGKESLANSQHEDDEYTHTDFSTLKN